MYIGPVLPLGQLGGRLGRKAKGGAKITKKVCETNQSIGHYGKKWGSFFMEKIFSAKIKEKLLTCHIFMVWGRKIDDLA